MSKWLETTIGDQATLQRGFDITKVEQRPGKVPVISSGGISSYHDTVGVKGPGVVLGRKGVVGSVYYIEEDYWPHDTSLWVKDFHGNYPRFVYYFFKSVAPQIARMDVGSANPTLNRNHVHPMPIVWPPLPEQKAIASVLGALDDKIELNRRMNATLEAMARALFQSWFVDFDPVRAKLDGRQPPNLDPATTALFPDSFQDSELGPIPRGWRVAKFGEFIERMSVGQKYEQKTVCPVGKVPVLDQGKSGVIGFHNNEPGVIATLDKPVAVFANHTCYMRLITFPFSAIQNVLPFVGSCVDTLWAYYATVGRLTFSEYKGHWPDFVIQEATVPTRDLTEAFGRALKPLVTQIRNNEDQSRTLATLRDTLLPKLLSGELSVSAAEKEVTA